MNKKDNQRTSLTDRDTMRDEYDFSDAKRGVTAARYAEGANVAVADGGNVVIQVSGQGSLC